MVDVWNSSQKVVKFAFNPLANAKCAAYSCVSAMVDKMVSWLSQSFTKSFT